ncbi:ribosomal protein S18-alanine N-acetyltransferase [Quadrisphaera sp. DSM 44207]|uniref:ribosomal protein S18-alanine N-acetyltransferase n=1 Tax=Quadrisphaera sp. DSM 44207 TaxID=1881057 RepID=UPI000B821200|nr:ribosomal protein S18-alanine N-acetyltransferase [Quadrisphaera sp. DSM 44207]
MRWWDVQPVVALERELFGATAWTPELFWSELAAPDRWYAVLEADAEAGVEAGVEVGVEVGADAAVVGYAGLAAPAGGGEADVQTLAVAPAGQGRGLGRALLEALVERARERGAASVLLEVRADNEPARRLYAAAGFEHLAVRRRYYQPGDVDALVLRRRLR